MTTWYTADPHFGHTRISEFCDRPYASVEAMNTDLINRWNRVVQPDDQVYVLGDFALGRIADSLPLVSQLNGEKLLVPGNHDRCHPMHRQSQAWRTRYLEAGFAAVTAHLILAEIAGHTVQVSHFPPVGDSRDADRYDDWRPVDVEGQARVIHGHVHNRWRKNDRWINVGVDAWGGYPVPDHLLAALLAADAPRQLDPLPWTADDTWPGMRLLMGGDPR